MTVNAGNALLLLRARMAPVADVDAVLLMEASLSDVRVFDVRDPIRKSSAASRR